MKQTSALTALCLLALASAPALAQTPPPLSATVGSGSAESFLVLDFENGTAVTPDSSYAFGYRYDLPASGPAPTGLDMIQALANANIGFSYTDTVYSFGTAIDTFSYAGQSAGAFQTNGFWSYWLSPDGQQWTASDVGAGDRPLANGSYDGWAWDVNNEVTAGPTPPRANPAAVPEPGALGLLAPGLLALALAVARRRRPAEVA